MERGGGGKGRNTEKGREGKRREKREGEIVRDRDREERQNERESEREGGRVIKRAGEREQVGRNDTVKVKVADAVCLQVRK